MNRHSWLSIAVLALCVASSHAVAAASRPPAEYAEFVAAIRKADEIRDPLQRCLAYPDLPGNTWAPGVAKARCTMFLTPPLYSLDAIDTLLRQPDGATTLDDAFQTLLDAHFSEPAKREQISVAFMVFRDADADKAERIARAWLAASPGSPFAHTALGRVLAQRGWTARGSKFVRDTPEEDLRKMEAYFASAVEEYGMALKASPKLLPACTGLIGIGRQVSDTVEKFAEAHCLAADPASYYVIEQIMNAAEPRWGGSEAEMRSVTDYALARLAENPVLALFAFEADFYKVDLLKDTDEQALAVLEPAARKVPNAAYLRLVGGAYLRKGENWKALAYLSEALRFSPTYQQESRYRAVALQRLGEFAWARTEAERAVALDPDDGIAELVLGDVAGALDGPAAAIAHYQRAMKDDSVRETAYNGYCGALIDAHRLDEAGKCVDDLLAAYPQNGEGWRQRLVVIGYDAPGSLEAMERFLALHDAERWPYHAVAAPRVRTVLAAKNGTATPAEVFDARIVRARALEYSAIGRPYFERIKGGAKGFLEGAVGACNTTRKQPGIPVAFTAVMDVMPDGKVANIAMRPENAWTACFAKQLGTVLKLPPPPAGFDAGYPMTYEVGTR